MSTLQDVRGVRVAIEGCGHGELDGIYTSITHAAKLKGWDGIDLVIICGDFQAVRNSLDLNCMSVPLKYRQLGDFHAYYSGQRTAPYLTLFIGGNHEASNHLFELYYGGWVAPNIYYGGAANILRFGPLRIACMSGIWKGFDYRKPHHERLPYNQDDVKSIYHVRELDVRKLMQVRTQVDIGLSHDWPRNIQWFGDSAHLFRIKSHFEEDAMTGKLGNLAAESVLKKLRPAYWFSGHMHCKFDAFVDHRGAEAPGPGSGNTESSAGQPTTIAVPAKNEEEIDLDLDMDSDDQTASPVAATRTAADDIGKSSGQTATTDSARDVVTNGDSATNRDTTNPSAISNKATKFLALDKIGSSRHFLQLLEIDPISEQSSTVASQLPYTLQYDPEWLAITRAFASELSLTSDNQQAATSPDLGIAEYLPKIQAGEAWIETNIVQQGKLNVPMDFQIVAPVQDVRSEVHVSGHPFEYPSPQTAEYCQLLGIENKFAMGDDEIRTRNISAPAQEEEPSFGGGSRGRGGYRGGYQGRGRGRGGQRGGHRGGRGYRRG